MKRMIKEGAWFSMKLELTMNLNYSSNLHISIPHKIQDRRNQRGIGGGSSRDWESRNCEMRSRSFLSLSLSHAWQNGRRTEIVGRNKAKKRNDRSLRVL